MEVARRCSVSQSTVSRVLNNKKLGRYTISRPVRERILKVAQELNYRPSVAARTLVGAQTKLIGILGVRGLWTDQVGPEEDAVGALAKVLDAEGYEACFQFAGLGRKSFDLPPLRVEGIVAVGATRQSELQMLENSGIPYVGLNGLVGPRGVQVIPDDAHGTRMAVEFLASLGHERIAYFDHPSATASHPGVFARRSAFAKALRDFDLKSPPLDSPNLPDDVSWDLAYAPFLKQAVIDGGATAVLAYSHFMAVSLLRVANDMHLRVPDDFNLICFNNATFLKLCIPSITAVDLPSTAMGQTTANVLVEMLKRGKLPAQRIQKLKETLIVRESTAAVGMKSDRRPVAYKNS